MILRSLLFAVGSSCALLVVFCLAFVGVVVCCSLVVVRCSFFVV